MKILHLSDTHNVHCAFEDMPQADVIVHSGDFTVNGTEEEVLDFLNWFIELPYKNKVFVTGNHDICLWDACDIEDLPESVHFLNDRKVYIDGICFFGLSYNHNVSIIPDGADVLVTHEPPYMILDESGCNHWGNVSLRKRVYEVKPGFHLFGHAHESHGTLKDENIVFSNGSMMDDSYNMLYKPMLFDICL